MAPDAVYARIENELASGELTKAREEAKAASDFFALKQPEWAAVFRIELGKVLIYQGESARALTLLQQPLPQSSSTDSHVMRDIFLSIAEARLDHLDEAEQTLRQVELQCSACALRSEIYSTRGSLELEKNNLDDAERAFRAALAGSRSHEDKFLQTRCLMNLAVIAMREEHYEDSVASFSEASDLARSIGAKLVLEKADGNLGYIYYKIGDFQRSFENSQKAEREAADLGSSLDQVAWLKDAGLSEYRLGDMNAARSLYEKSLALAQSIQNPDETLDVHVNLGFLLLRLNRLDAAQDHIRDAQKIAIERKNDRAGLRMMLLESLLLTSRGDQQGAIKLLTNLEDQAADVPSMRWAAESTMARVYEGTADRKNAGRWFQRSIETFRLQRSSLRNVESTLPFLENANDIYADYTDFLIQGRETDEALNVVDESRAEALADGLKLPPLKRTSSLNARSIASRVQATILVYSLRPKVSYVWAITPARQQFYELPGSETIVPLIHSHTKAILASKDVQAQPNAPGHELYQALVKPVEGMIPKGGKVFIISDEALSSLNFETLLAGNESPHFWIEDVAITNAKSLRLLSVNSERQEHYADRRMLLIGDPVYRENEYATLPNAAQEVANVAGHFAADHRTVLTGVQASPDGYRDHQPGGFSYIHFVAHATANMTAPLDSAVVLSRDHGDGGIYKLYARDILQQNLHADLVTLSSCYGSGSRQYTGEGLVGLAWAFLRAGSHHVIGAMWEVSDASTPLLMDDLYRELAKGSQPDVALRSAKLAMLHSAGVFRKPLYWAPFLLYSGA